MKNKWYLRSLEESATLDGMTGLFNHRAAMEQLEYQVNVAIRSGRPLSLAYIDLNDLKPVNDSLGHEGGDQMIIAAADSITNSIRKTDIAARVGGDEFVVIFPGLLSDNAREAICRIELLYAQKGHELFKRELSLSWGVSLWEGENDTAETLISRADTAMYAMKKEGKRFTNRKTT